MELRVHGAGDRESHAKRMTLYWSQNMNDEKEVALLGPAPSRDSRSKVMRWKQVPPVLGTEGRPRALPPAQMWISHAVPA